MAEEMPLGVGGVSPGHYKKLEFIGTDKGLMDLTNLITNPADEPGMELTPGMKKAESSEILNLTLHQSARNGDVRSAQILISHMGGNLKKKINAKDEDLLTPLHYAARYNHLHVCKLLVESMADLNTKDEEGLTPLHYASRSKTELQKRMTKLDTPQALEEEEEDVAANGLPVSDTADDLQAQEQSVVIYLVNRGANINEQDIYGQTPLHYAAMRGNEKAAADLLSFKRMINIEAEDKQRMTALHMAATHNQVQIAEMLIEAKGNLRCIDNEDSTPLHMAASEGNIEIVRMLFEAGAKKDGWVTISNMVTDKDCDEGTALHMAVENGHFDIVKLCLEKRADVNVPTAHYVYPLHLAAVSGDVRIARLLVEHNGRIDCLNDEQATPLHKAAQFNHVQVVEFLVDRGARIDKRDKDHFTPLLLAAVYGHSETVDLLLKKGADYQAVDKNDKTAIFLASEEDKVDVLQTLLSHPGVRSLINVSDRYDNDPLHIAAESGYLEVVKALLDNGGDLDSKNEEEQTPLHLASKAGKTKIVREIVTRDKTVVNDENENSNTALHLAALYGHTKVAFVLIQNGADVAARNYSLWTPLDCAAARGWPKTLQVLLEADAPVDPMDKTKTTPLHLGSRYGHDGVVEVLMKWSANVRQRDLDGNNCLDLAIDNNHVNVAMCIINSDHWEEALQNETLDLNTGHRNTPMRKLIKKMPDVAEMAFNKCMTDNKMGYEHPQYQITFNYEFLDDAYSSWGEEGTSEVGSSSGSVYDEEFKLSKSAKPYTTDTGSRKKNHPLMIMVLNNREDLLAHPLVTALLRYKWGSFGRQFYYINFLLYLVFLTFLTGYVVTAQPPWAVNTTGTTATMCEASQGVMTQHIFAKIGKYIIMALAAWNLLRELIQIYQAKLNYLGWENLIEWITYITALLLVIDFLPCQRDTGYRFEWQWSVGAIAIFLTWVNLVLFIQKFPRLGIYVVMFKDILNTFVQFFIVFFFFIIAFALGFYTLLQNQDPFVSVWQALIKTSVMMIGEFEYDAIFNNPDETVYYKETSYLLFVIFMVIMSILIMNLLVGLAVDDIKEVQEQAALKRMAMQVEMALDVERVVPEFIRRRFVIKCQSHKPNEKTRNPFKMLMNIESGDLSTAAIYKSLNPELEDIEKVMEAQEKLQKEVTKLRSNMKEVRQQNGRLESMLIAVLQNQGIRWQEDDIQVDD